MVHLEGAEGGKSLVWARKASFGVEEQGTRHASWKLVSNNVRGGVFKARGWVRARKNSKSLDPAWGHPLQEHNREDE